MGFLDGLTGNTAQTTTTVAQKKTAVLIQMTPNDLAMIIFFVALAVGVLAWIITLVYKVYIAKRFPYDVTLKYVVYDRCLVKQTKARIKYRKGQSEIFVFKGSFFKKLNAPIPPEKTVEILASGRYYVKGYVRKTDNVVWAEDITEWEKIDVLVDGKTRVSIDEHIQPITQQHRALWFDEMRKAERDKTQSLSKMLMAIAPMLMVIIIFVMVIIFWKDITNPIIQAEQLQKEMKELDIKIIDKLNVLYKIQNGTQLSLYDKQVFNDTEENRFNSRQVLN